MNSDGIDEITLALQKSAILAPNIDTEDDEFYDDYSYEYVPERYGSDYGNRRDDGSYSDYSNREIDYSDEEEYDEDYDDYKGYYEEQGSISC